MNILFLIKFSILAIFGTCLFYYICHAIAALIDFIKTDREIKNFYNELDKE